MAKIFIDLDETIIGCSSFPDDAVPRYLPEEREQILPKEREEHDSERLRL
jgi:hypothetical protein